MTKAHHLKPRKSNDLALAVPINFLLGCSQNALADFVLARYAGAADSLREVHAALDGLVQETALALLAEWFRTVDPHDLKLVLENPDDVMEWAREQIRTRGRSKEEVERDLIPLPCLPPGAAHLAAAVRYAERNIAEGLCSVCPKPLAHHSVRYCDEHLAKALGLSSEDAAVRREDAKKALARSDARQIPRNDSSRAFRESWSNHENHRPAGFADLLAAKQIQRIGQGGMRDAYRYFK